MWKSPTFCPSSMHVDKYLMGTYYNPSPIKDDLSLPSRATPDDKTKLVPIEQGNMIRY